MSAEPAFAADFARHARNFGGERAQLLDHRVQRFFQLQDFAAHVDRDFLGEIAVRDGSGDFGDVANLAGEVAGHEVHVIGEIFPGAGDAGHLRLSAEFAVGADFARYARHFAGERVELIHHGVDGVLEFENFAFHVDRDLARKIAAGDGGGHFGDIADLAGEVPGHGVDGVGEIFPGSGDARYVGLAPRRPSVPTSRATRVTSPANALSWSTMVLMVSLSAEFPADIDRNFLRQDHRSRWLWQLPRCYELGP